jgi:hypothetical protein
VSPSDDNRGRQQWSGSICRPNKAVPMPNTDVNAFDHGHALRPALPTPGEGVDGVTMQTMRTQQTGVCVKIPLLYGLKGKSGVGERIIGYSFDERSCC